MTSISQSEVKLPFDPPFPFPCPGAFVPKSVAEPAEIAKADSMADGIEHFGEACAFGAGEEVLGGEFPEDDSGGNHVEEN